MKKETVIPMFLPKRRQRQWKQGSYLYLSDSVSNLDGTSDAAISTSLDLEHESTVGCQSSGNCKSEIVVSPCHNPNKKNSLATGIWMGSSLSSPSPLSPPSSQIVLGSPACSSITTSTPTTPRTASSFWLEDHNFQWLAGCKHDGKKNEALGLSFETATAIQKSYTSWPSTIWDMNFDDADEEIVFEADDGDLAEDNKTDCQLFSMGTTTTTSSSNNNNNNKTGMVESKPCLVESDKRSDGDKLNEDDNNTVDTEDETMPSACASPDFSAAWELEELDLSIIEDVSEDEDGDFFSCDDETSEEEEDAEDDEYYDSFDLPQLSPVAGSSQRLDSSPRPRDEDCALLACSTDLKNRFLGATTSIVQRQRKQPASLFRGVLEDAPSSSSTTSTSSSGSRQSYLEIEESFGLAHGDRPDVSLSPVDPRKQLRRRSICFADEVGKPMEEVHLVERRDSDDRSNVSYDPTLQRLLVLFLCPEEKKFEFVHAEYSTQQSRVAVSSLLEQVTKFVTDLTIRKKQYVRLCTADGIELINALSIQEYGLKDDEVVVAVLQGYTGATMHTMAKGLIQNEEILKAVKQTNRSEHTLFRVKSNGELYEIQKQAREIKTSNLSKALLQENHDEQLVAWRSLGSTNNMDSGNSNLASPSGGIDESKQLDQIHDDMKRRLLATPLRDVSSNNIDAEGTDARNIESPLPGTPEKKKAAHKGKRSPVQSPRSNSGQNEHEPYRHSLLLRSGDTAEKSSLPAKQVINTVKLLQPSWRKSTPATCQTDNDRLEHRDCVSSVDGRKNVKRLNFGFLQRQSSKSNVVAEQPLNESNKHEVDEAAQEASRCEESLKSGSAPTRRVNWASRVAKKGWKNLKSIGTRKRIPGKP